MLPHPPVPLSPDAWAGEVERQPAPGRAVMPDRGSSKMRSESFDALLAEARRARQEKPRARREPSPRSPCRLRRTFSRCGKTGSAGPPMRRSRPAPFFEGFFEGLSSRVTRAVCLSLRISACIFSVCIFSVWVFSVFYLSSLLLLTIPTQIFLSLVFQRNILKKVFLSLVFFARPTRSSLRFAPFVAQGIL